MPRHSRLRTRWTTMLAALLAMSGGSAGAEDEVVLQSGTRLKGDIDRDNAIVSVFDGLKRTVVRDSKIARITPIPTTQRQDPERFRLDQPLEQHGGEMPSHALGIQATPWDEFGQRLFSYSVYKDARTRRTVRMKQAINAIGPDYVSFRGIDGFWLGLLSTDQVPRDVILGLLGRVDRKVQNERLRVGRFLIQAKWYEEASAELGRLAVDFPDLQETVTSVRQMVRDLEARQTLEEAELRSKVGQPATAEALLSTFNRAGVSDALNAELDAALKQVREAAARTKEISDDLKALLDAQPELAVAWKEPVFDILQALTEAPDLANGRLKAFLESRGGAADPKARLSLAISGWSLGQDHATPDLTTTEALWATRDRISRYLSEHDALARQRLLDELRKTTVPGGQPGETRAPSLEEATWIVQQLPPPRADKAAEPGAPLIRRVEDDSNATPTEYVIQLPPEYHPLRSYPVIVVLDGGRGTGAAMEPWRTEATRHGFILIAPEYLSGTEAPDYRYSPDEHAAVQLALRDARKRFAIDSDRVFLAGMVMGGNATWDIGLAHPDLFAGLAPISGLPAKYANRLREHAEFAAMHITVGDLSTAATETMVFDPIKAMISKTWDVTYVEYVRRGLEELPEEVPSVVDWMSRRKRTRYRKDFEAKAGRPGDDRFFGVVVRAFTPGRVVLPEVVDPLGNDLKPATIEYKLSPTANLIAMTVGGIDGIDLWLPPEGIDFGRKVQVRVNGKRLFQDLVKPDLGAFLEDIRLRGDRQQVFWAKIPLGGRSS